MCMLQLFVQIAIENIYHMLLLRFEKYTSYARRPSFSRGCLFRCMPSCVRSMPIFSCFCAGMLFAPSSHSGLVFQMLCDLFFLLVHFCHDWTNFNPEGVNPSWQKVQTTVTIPNCQAWLCMRSAFRLHTHTHLFPR